MKKTDLFLMIRPDTREQPQQVPWKGYLSNTDGLVVCRAPRYKEGWTPSKDEWQVIHHKSGYVLPYCYDLYSMKVALTTASLLGAFFDWTQSKDEIFEQSRGKFKPIEIYKTVERVKRQDMGMEVL